MKNIEWTDVTWNPLTGCKHGCTWTAPDGKVVECYAKTICERFKHQDDFTEPMWHPERLEQPYKWRKPRRVFVCSMADLFGDWVSSEQIHAVGEVIEANPQHTFLILTKNYNRLNLTRWNWLHNLHLGISVDSSRTDLPMYQAAIKWISFEPLVEDVCHINSKAYGLGSIHHFDWVVIGALSAGAKKYQPKREWVENILRAAEGLPVFMKDNLDCAALGIERRQEYPNETR